MCSAAAESGPRSETMHEVYEQHQVADCGEFTAYKDGSVHVSFSDRTLLYMEASHTHCNIVTSEGHRVIVATSTPVGVESYVAQAVEYAEWAFSTPAERAAALQQSASIAKEIRKCMRGAALCDWAQGKPNQMQSSPKDHEDNDMHASCALPNSNMLWSQAIAISHNASVKSGLNAFAAPSERETLIQALLAKSGQLLSSLT